MTANNILTTEYRKMNREERINYIKKNGEMKVLSTYAKGSWDDIQFEANKMGCKVGRGFDAELRKMGKFDEYYRFVIM